MSDYVIRVQHSVETVTAMVLAQEVATRGLRRTVQVITAAVCLLLGTRFVGDIAKPYNYLFSLYGCFAIVFLNFPAKQRARQVVRSIEASGKAFPCSVFEFTKEGFRVKPEGTSGLGAWHPYSDVMRLFAYRGALYCFISDQAAFIFPASSFGPEQQDVFKRHLSERTGLNWQEPGRWLRANLRSVLRKQR